MRNATEQVVARQFQYLQRSQLAHTFRQGADERCTTNGDCRDIAKRVAMQAAPQWKAARQLAREVGARVVASARRCFRAVPMLPIAASPLTQSRDMHHARGCNEVTKRFPLCVQCFLRICGYWFLIVQSFHLVC